MEQRTRNLVALTTCQALSFAASSTLFTVGSLAARTLADDASLATLPLTTAIVATALTTLPMSFFMRRAGRRAGFLGGGLAGAVGTALALAALPLRSFTLLCVGMFLYGINQAAAQYYRFAAAEIGTVPQRASAISTVLAGSVFGGLLGPEVSKHVVNALPLPYAGAYVAVLVYLAVGALVALSLRMPQVHEEQAAGEARTFTAIASQPMFLVAVSGAALGFGVMVLLMLATPLAMAGCGHGYGDTAFVIQWHLAGMFVPSFVTGRLVGRFGAPVVMLAGAALQAACVAIALSGVEVAHFWGALLLLGVGWNFLYVGATTLLTDTYRPAERAKVQGANELVVSLTQATASAAAGWMVARGGWAAPNHVAVPLVLAAAVVSVLGSARARR